MYEHIYTGIPFRSDSIGDRLSYPPSAYHYEKKTISLTFMFVLLSPICSAQKGTFSSIADICRSSKLKRSWYGTHVFRVKLPPRVMAAGSWKHTNSSHDLFTTISIPTGSEVSRWIENSRLMLGTGILTPVMYTASSVSTEPSEDDRSWGLAWRWIIGASSSGRR